jgi:hypothetical protein
MFTLASVQALIFLGTEVFKLVTAHLAQKGTLNNLTQEQAELMVKKLAVTLPDALPTPEELEKMVIANPLTQ